MSTIKKMVGQCANILLAHAIKNNQLQEISNDVLVLSAQFKTHPLLNHVFNNPTLSPTQKNIVLTTLCQTAHPILQKFIAILMKQHHLGYLSQILTAFITEYYKHIGIQSAILTTAIALPSTLIQILIKEIKQIVDCKEVLLEQHIDPTIIGGYTLQIGELKLDRSIKYYLYLLKTHFT